MVVVFVECGGGGVGGGVGVGVVGGVVVGGGASYRSFEKLATELNGKGEGKKNNEKN